MNEGRGRLAQAARDKAHPGTVGWHVPQGRASPRSQELLPAVGGGSMGIPSRSLGCPVCRSMEIRVWKGAYRHRHGAPWLPWRGRIRLVQAKVLVKWLSGFDVGVIMYTLPLKSTAQLPRLMLVDGSTAHICWGFNVAS